MQRNLITFSKRTLIFRGGPNPRKEIHIWTGGVQIHGVGGKSKSAVTCVHEFFYKKPVLITRKHVNIEIKTYCYKRTA